MARGCLLRSVPVSRDARIAPGATSPRNGLVNAAGTNHCGGCPTEEFLLILSLVPFLMSSLHLKFEFESAIFTDKTVAIILTAQDFAGV